MKYVIAAVLLILIAGAVGCVRVSGGTWYLQSAALPEGWPELTPVGLVEVKEYPAYRAAFVQGSDVRSDGVEPMFMELFRHIKESDIAMTAPVEMRYRTSEGATQMESMAFLYRNRETGAPGADGVVRIRDFTPQYFATLGVRGDYTERTYEKALTTLQRWLESNSNFVVAVGPPRSLGYNGPFVPTFMRYGEIQIPVRYTR